MRSRSIRRLRRDDRRDVPVEQRPAPTGAALPLAPRSSRHRATRERTRSPNTRAASDSEKANLQPREEVPTGAPNCDNKGETGVDPWTEPVVGVRCLTGEWPFREIKPALANLYAAPSTVPECSNAEHRCSHQLQSAWQDCVGRVLCTGKQIQLVLMVLQPGEQIREEVQRCRAQFFCVEKGKGEVFFHACSQITSSASLSLRRLRKVGCRISPSSSTR
jgi:hypothetical protein